MSNNGTNVYINTNQYWVKLTSASDIYDTVLQAVLLLLESIEMLTLYRQFFRKGGGGGT